MTIIVTGGRSYELTIEDEQFLDRLRVSLPITKIITGGATGADAGAAAWAERRGVPCQAYPADWKTFGRSAGPRRNTEMAKLGDQVVAFPGGRGTADMIRKASEYGLPLHESPSRAGHHSLAR